MPKIPIYEQQIENKDTPLEFSNLKTTVEQFGGGNANIQQTILKTADVANSIYQREKKKADQIRLDDAESKLIESETKLLHDKNTGALNQKGEKAFKLDETVLPEFDKQAKNIYSTLSNDDQKQGFERIIQKRKMSIDRQLQSHISQETYRHDVSTTTNYVKNQQDSAINNWKDVSLVQDSVKEQERSIRSFGERNGLSEDEIVQKINDAKTNTHKSVINTMLQNDQELAAQKYFDMHENEIFGDDKAVLTKMIEDGSIRKQSQDFVNEAFKSKMSEREAIDKASLLEGKLRDETLSRVKTEFAMRDAIKRDETEQSHLNALNKIDSGSVKDLTKLPGWYNFTENQRSSLMGYAKRKTEGNDVGNYTLYLNLREQASNPATADKFLKTNLLEYADKLSKPEMEKLLSLRDGLRKGDNKADQQNKSFSSNNESLKSLYNSAGFDSKDKEKYAKFHNIVETQQLLLQEQLKRPLTKIELLDIAREQLNKKTIDRKFWFDKELAPFEIEDVEDYKKIKFNEIPKIKIDSIRADLIKAKKPSSDEVVRQIYIKSLMRGR